MRNFVLSEAKAGKPVVTANGMPARIICFDAKGPFPLVALVSENRQEVLHIYTKAGKYNLAGGSVLDLMMQEENCSNTTTNPVRWIDDEDRKVNGYYINTYSDLKEVYELEYIPENRNVFATKRQAQSALALAQLTQIIANDPRFGGPITDEEWSSDDSKYVIRRCDSIHSKGFEVFGAFSFFSLLAFHTKGQAELFLEENESLLKDYFMI